MRTSIFGNLTTLKEERHNFFPTKDNFKKDKDISVNDKENK